jgi:hypothetical protein
MVGATTFATTYPKALALTYVQSVSGFPAFPEATAAVSNPAVTAAKVIYVE